jgi:hypothetical protein
MSTASLDLTRRQFGMTLAAANASSVVMAATGEDAPWSGPAIVRKVFVGIPKPTWPRPDLDFKQEMAGISGKLDELERRHPGLVRFTGGEWLKAPGDVEPWAKGLSDVDAVLLLDLTSSTSGIYAALDKVDIPKLLFTRPITGWAFLDGARWIQQGRKCDMVASSSFEDLAPHLPMLRTMHHLRHSKVLIVREGASARGGAEGFTRQFGTAMAFPSYQDLKAAYDAVDPGKARDEAREFTRGALKVVEPSASDIEKAARFHLAMKAVLAEEKANAITIDCLGGFHRGDLPAYPCMAWSKLNDEGLYGVCESDLLSTMTQLLLTSYSGRPGFVSDPSFDIHRNEVIHAHCVAATCMKGVGGKNSPYIIRSHMEDNQGVSVQVQMPLGEVVTCAKFSAPDTFLVSTGEVTSNLDSPRGCRTKIVTKVADARKFVEGYTGGLHRVLFYGDYVRAVERMGRLMGFRVVKEG